MQVRSRREIALRVYERGAGETLACGTGACAAVVAGIRLGWLDAQVDVHARGGLLTIEWPGGDSAGADDRPGRNGFRRRDRTVITNALQGITENDIAEYLANTPGFFERHAEMLATIQLTSPHGQRAVSLQERQMEMLRERIKGLEKKIVEMIRNGQDNVRHRRAPAPLDACADDHRQPGRTARGAGARA